MLKFQNWLQEIIACYTVMFKYPRSFYKAALRGDRVICYLSHPDEGALIIYVAEFEELNDTGYEII